MTKQETDCACGIGAVSTRKPFDSDWRSKTPIAGHGIEAPVAGEKMQKAVAAQPEWLGRVPTSLRLSEGRVAAVGCGTSFHAAQTSGDGIDALEAVLSPPDADVVVLVSHEGETPLTLEAARAFPGPKWLVTAKSEGPIAALCDEVVIATPEVEESYCHTA